MGSGRRRTVRVALAASGVVLGMLAAPPAATAGGDDYTDDCKLSNASCQTGKKVTGTVGPFNKCASTATAEVCVGYDADTVFVKDRAADGHSAVAYISAQFGAVDLRYCRNTQGNGTWVKCDFDWAEDGSKEVYAGHLDGRSAKVTYKWTFSGK